MKVLPQKFFSYINRDFWGPGYHAASSSGNGAWDFILTYGTVPGFNRGVLAAHSFLVIIFRGFSPIIQESES